MGKQTIYLKNDIEDKIKDIANNEGISISEVIRRRVESSFKHEESTKKIEAKLESIYAVLYLIVGDIAYVSGATRASTRSHENIRLEGTKYEDQILQMLNAIGKPFLQKENRT